MKLIQAGLPRDVSKYNRSAVHEAAGGDGAVLRILNRFVGAGGGDSHLLRRCLIFLLGLLGVAHRLKGYSQN